ncbi:MAG: FtsX-like permease family protein [Bacteroidota bacterium]
MFRSFFHTTLRSLARQRVHSTVNLLGLALGISVSGVLLLFAYQEFSYDRHVPGHEQVYRVETVMTDAWTLARSTWGLDSVLQERFPGVESATYLMNRSGGLTAQRVDFEEQTYFLAGENYFEVFPHEFLYGSAERALSGTNQVVLSEEAALKYFGRVNVVGEELDRKWEGERVPYTVSAVIRVPNRPSHIRPEVLMTPQIQETTAAYNLRSGVAFQYARLAERFGKDYLQASLEELIETDLYTAEVQDGSLAYEEWRSQSAFRFDVYGLAEIHLHSQGILDIAKKGNRSKVLAFLAIGLGILLIAIFNFVNMSTAMAMRRSKEVGVRKVLGSQRSLLVLQFVGESVITCLLASILGLALGEVFITLIHGYVGMAFMESLWTQWHMWPWVLVYALTVGTLAGLYPSLLLSRFQPIRIFRNQFNTSMGRRWSLRDGLVVAQYAITALLLMGILLIRSQINHLHTLDLGLDRDNVLVVENFNKLTAAQQETFRQEVEQLAGVQTSGISGRVPGGNMFATKWLQTDQEETLELQWFPGDAFQREALGIPLIAGRDINPDLPTDSTALLINRAAAELIEDPLAQDRLNIVGIVEDFCFANFYEEPLPMVFDVLVEDGFWNPLLFVNLNPAYNGQEAQAALTQLWDPLSEEAISLSWVDEAYAAQLQEEHSLLRSLHVFAGLAVFISMLGLFGLSAFIATQRTKEIGIRKVLGATVGQVVVLLNRRFSGPILLALGVALPVGVLLGNQWLESFAYRVSWSVGIFLATFLLSIGIGWLAMAYHSLKTARANPVKSLRYE